MKVLILTLLFYIGCSENESQNLRKDDAFNATSASSDDNEAVQPPGNVSGAFLADISCKELPATEPNSSRAACHLINKETQKRIEVKSIAATWKWGIEETSSTSAYVTEIVDGDYDVVYVISGNPSDYLETVISFDYIAKDTRQSFTLMKKIEAALADLRDNNRFKLNISSLDMPDSQDNVVLDSLELLVDDTWEQVCGNVNGRSLIDRIPEDQLQAASDAFASGDLAFFKDYIRMEDLHFTLGKRDKFAMDLSSNEGLALQYLMYFAGVDSNIELAGTGFQAVEPYDAQKGSEIVFELKFEQNVSIRGVRFLCRVNGVDRQVCSPGNLPQAMPDKFLVEFFDKTSDSFKPAGGQTFAKDDSEFWTMLWGNKVKDGVVNNTSPCKFKISLF